MRVTTLSAFRATGRDVADLREVMDYCSDAPEPGRVYAGGAYLVRVDADSWLMIWGSLQWLDTLEVCESILYIYAILERAEDMRVSDAMRDLVSHFVDEVGDVETVATWIASHPDDSCADDFMDVAPVAAEIFGDYSELNEDGIDALIAEFQEWTDQGAFATDDTRSNGRNWT